MCMSVNFLRMRKSLSSAKKKKSAPANSWRCASCNHILPACFQIDHVIPLADGGEDKASNMQPLCPGCHADKTQVEAIQRGKRKVQRFLYCPICESKVSPYFLHKCV